MPKTIDPKKKSKVLKYIKDYDAQHGRGGQAAAAKKFGLTPQTIIRWNRKAAKATGASKASAKAPAAKSAPAAKVPSKSAAASRPSGANKAAAMAKLDTIARYQAQIAELEQKIEHEKQALLQML